MDVDNRCAECMYNLWTEREKKMGEKLALFHLNEKCMLVRERQFKWQPYELKKIHKEANTR